MPPYTVQYLCPRQSPNWQSGNRSLYSLAQARALCMVVKPPRGWARVLDGYGNVVFQV
jgi:hypothetical protein